MKYLFALRIFISAICRRCIPGLTPATPIYAQCATLYLPKTRDGCDRPNCIHYRWKPLPKNYQPLPFYCSTELNGRFMISYCCCLLNRLGWMPALSLRPPRARPGPPSEIRRPPDPRAFVANCRVFLETFQETAREFVRLSIILQFYKCVDFNTELRFYFQRMNLIRHS